MVDYSKGKIYLISLGEDKYIGSTCQRLCQRKGNHRRDSTDEKCPSYNNKLYTLIRERGWDEFKIELLINYPCSNKEELLMMEQKYIDEIKPNLNTNDAIAKFKKGTKEYHINVVKNHPSYTNKHWCSDCGKEILTRNLSNHKNTLIHKKNENTFYLENIFIF